MEKIREAARADVQDRTRMLVQAGALAALGCAATMVLRIPSPTGGYLNLGDAVVLLGLTCWARHGARWPAESVRPWQICWRATRPMCRLLWSSRL